MIFFGSNLAPTGCQKNNFLINIEKNILKQRVIIIQKNKVKENIKI